MNIEYFVFNWHLFKVDTAARYNQTVAWTNVCCFLITMFTTHNTLKRRYTHFYTIESMFTQD